MPSLDLTQHSPRKKERLRYHKWKSYKDHGQFYQAYRPIRDTYIMKHPLDELEQIEGRTVVAEECHHCYEISNGMNDAEKMLIACDEDNLIMLSKDNHINIHNHEERLTDRQKQAVISRRNKIERKLEHYRQGLGYV